MFREFHSHHEQEAFPNDPRDDKDLVNAAAFGSGLALRSPHLWLLQRQLQGASLALLKKPEYAAIATASHLNSRPRRVVQSVRAAANARG